MKNLSASLLFVLLALASQLASAQTTRRVNNTGITGTNIYNDVQAAINAAAAGDVIQVEPSGVDYPGFTVNKNVTIVGPGYFLDSSQNAGLQANPLSASVSSIQLQAGGTGAYVAGLEVGTYYVGASNCTIQRCKISQLYLNYNSGLGGQNLTNVNIKQNYISNLSQYYSNNIDNLLIVNNIISSISLPTNYNGGFFNNVVLSNATLNNFFVGSNYFTSNLSGTGNTLNNNISASTSFPTTNGNQANVAQSAVFVLSPGTTAFDAWYQLKAGTNPARGAGQSGTDVGAFGGNSPYKLGGLPNIPAIYQQSQTITGNTLNVTLSTRSNN
jgi:hypothetical protein